MESFYTGIGSQKTPPDACMLMSRFARLQRRRCRSGAAKGADQAHETNWNILAYLPWPAFNNRPGHHRYREEHLEFAESVVKSVWPYTLKNEVTKKFFRRNVFQVLGLCSSVKEVHLSDFVLCWTPDGCISAAEYKLGVTGGTGIAILIACLYGVPVYNIQREDHRAKVIRWCKKKEKELGLTYCKRTGIHTTRDGGVPFDPATIYGKAA